MSETQEKLKLSFKSPVYVADNDSANSAIQIIGSSLSDRHERVAAFDKENRSDFELRPIHTIENPIVFRFPNSDRRHSIYMWADYDEDNWIDAGNGEKIPDFEKAIAIMCNLNLNENGKIESEVPVAIMVGEKFEGVFEYSVSNVDDPQVGLSALVFLLDDEGEMTYHTRDAINTPRDTKFYFEKLHENHDRSHGIIRSAKLISMIYEQHCGIALPLEACPRQMFSPISRLEPQ